MHVPNVSFYTGSLTVYLFGLSHPTATRWDGVTAGLGSKGAPSRSY